jgi:hypothetical protein
MSCVWDGITEYTVIKDVPATSSHTDALSGIERLYLYVVVDLMYCDIL